MKYVKFGKTGETVSEMCLGTMMFGDRCDESESHRILDMALDNGVNIIDTAESYTKGVTEEILGRYIKKMKNRDKIFLVTKGHIGGKSFEQRVEESLKRLQTDYIDCYLVHWPKEGMDVEEVMTSLDKVVKSGKVKYIGCSNYPAWLLGYSNKYALSNKLNEFVCHEIPYNLIERGVEVEVLPQAIAENIAVLSYRPLAMGLLTEKYIRSESIPSDSRGSSDERIIKWLEKYRDGINKLYEFSKEKGVSMVQLAIAWIRHSPAVTCPIVGVRTVSQLEASLKAFDVDLEEEEYNKITNMFDTEVKEESGGKYKSLRRNLFLISKNDK